MDDLYNMRVAFFFPAVIRMARVEEVTNARTACGTVLWSNSFLVRMLCIRVFLNLLKFALRYQFSYLHVYYLTSLDFAIIAH